MGYLKLLSLIMHSILYNANLTNFQENETSHILHCIHITAKALEKQNLQSR